MEFTSIKMANPDQKTILIEQAYRDLKEICQKFKDDSGSTDSEVEALLGELIDVWETKEKKQKSLGLDK